MNKHCSKGRGSGLRAIEQQAVPYYFIVIVAELRPSEKVAGLMHKPLP